MGNLIASKEQLARAAPRFGMLPFFANRIPGFSVQEMAAPGMLFGETRDDYGCWEWKGPVIQEQTTAYGKFFNRKAGFVSLDLLPDFLNYRRAAYPVNPDSTERMILDIIRENEGLSSTELKRIIFGTPSRKRKPEDLVEAMEYVRPKRHSIEGPLLIADFEYKLTARGDRYGWGVAVYSTPEIWFERSFRETDRTPSESLDFLVDTLSAKLPGATRNQLTSLLK